jgi:hypothetical protein
VVVVLVLGLAAPTAAAPIPAASTDAGIEFFEARIRPLLVKNCYECHSGQAKKIEGKLRLDSREALRRGGESGPAIVPGDPGQPARAGAAV